MRIILSQPNLRITGFRRGRVEMPLLPYLKAPLRLMIWSSYQWSRLVSRFGCVGLYDGRKAANHVTKFGDVDVILTSPPMADREGALIHPGVHILQNILRSQNITCEVLNYNLPTAHPRDPFDHLIQLVKTLNVRIVGVSLYSQAIRNTMSGLQRLRQACPDVKIVLGGPHPSEAWLSLLGLRFVDYVIRGEAELAFPQLVSCLLRDETIDVNQFPGVYKYNRDTGNVEGQPGEFVDLSPLDEHNHLRYILSKDEIEQYRRFRGTHGLVGPRYWPIALVRGCPYDCTYCAAFRMSGKRLRYRDVKCVVDDLEFYVQEYGQRDFSFVDDSFTEHYEFVTEFCHEITRRQLNIRWTTDNGIRYETLGSGNRVRSFLASTGLGEIDSLVRLMIRAGWRGTSIGVESGSPRVRRELVRKGGRQLSNDEIQEDLCHLKRIAEEEGVYFYINAYLMLGFPELVLPNGKIVPGETEAEREETYHFAMQLRDCGAIDFMLVSILIPLPATDMWEHLDIEQRMALLLATAPKDGPVRERLEEIRQRVLDEARRRWPQSCYMIEPETYFWQQVYDLPDEVQIEINGAFDHFNADWSHNIRLKRPEGRELFRLRQQLFEEFYGGFKYEWKLMKHVASRSSTVRDVVSYLSFLGKTYLPDTRMMP